MLIIERETYTTMVDNHKDINEKVFMPLFQKSNSSRVLAFTSNAVVYLKYYCHRDFIEINLQASFI